MSKLLTPITLRQRLAEMNTLLEDYSGEYQTIADEVNSLKNAAKQIYNEESAKQAESISTKTEELEKEFLKQKHKIEKSLHQEQTEVSETFEQTINSVSQSYTETAETTRRYTAEEINNKKQQQDTEVVNLQAEADSAIQLLSETQEQSSLLDPLLIKFNLLKTPKNKAKALLKSTDEVEINNLLAEYDNSDDLDRIQELSTSSNKLISQVSNSPLTKLFRKLSPTILYIVVILFSVLLVGASFKLNNILPTKIAAIISTCIFLLFSLIHIFYKLSKSKKLETISNETAEIKSLVEFSKQCELAKLDAKIAAENKTYKLQKQAEEIKLNNEIQQLDAQRDSELKKVQTEQKSALTSCQQNNAEDIETLALDHNKNLEELETQAEKELSAITSKYENEVAAVLSKENTLITQLTDKWQVKWLQSLELFEELQALSKNSEQNQFPAWTDDFEKWQPPQNFHGAIPFGNLKMDLAKELVIPENNCLDFSEGIPFNIPALLELPEQGSLCITTKDSEARDAAIHLIQSTVLRILMTVPPGKAKFNFIDPLSLGETFAGFMHLNDYKEDLTGGRIATNTRQIEKQLADLNEHMEVVIQKYLRNEFKDICEYNEKVGEIAEPFRFLVIADFPVNFSEEAVKRLISISKSGARCGVYIILHRDSKHSLPGEFTADDLESSSIFLEYLFGDLDWRNCGFRLADFTVDNLPNSETVNSIIKKVGSASIDATRVEIPFTRIQHPEFWTESSADELKAAIGLSGAKKQYLTFGHGTSQHCLIAGKTGSGKSNLMHIIIENMALSYSPDELSFYLIDFKKGVEFKSYATFKLPHAKAIAIESDREFGLSVLRKIDQDLKDRGEELRSANAQNISQYRQSTKKKMARILLVIDEFQEIFVEDDMVAQEAALLLDRIVRQGRAFGIHVILGSQTLAGTYSLPRATMGQMTIRIALQCSESDSYVILNESNNAARLLSRPGEAIYNDQAGLPEGNNPFQAAYLNEETKTKVLKQIQASSAEYKAPYIFEGNIPAEITQSQSFSKLASSQSTTLKMILGEPNAIRDSQTLTLESLPGQNVLVIGQKEEAALATFSSMILSAIKQSNDKKFNICILDGSSSENSRKDYFESLLAETSVNYHILTPVTAEDWIKTLYENKNENDETTLTFIFGFHRFRKLKNEDSFSWDEETKSSGAMLSELISDGPANNTHTICWVDSWNSYSRMASRKSLNDYVHRVLFQMSQADSISLIDTAEASKLGLHTAILFDDQSGELIKYRPFLLPDKTSIQQILN
ncbi:MAG: FtsK/SpoIIIE domain-containing protein [Lentisphaeraceae bacterium]|nr:FtsK/SpoIIIE domain-containing protein [Lentisphaeraceae bacterium]